METVLRKKRIAVVSGRRSVSDFFRLEGDVCNCLVSVMSVLPSVPSEYDIIIFDDDGSIDARVFPENIYRIIPDGEERGDKTLSWPLSVFRAREIFEGYVIENISQTKTGENTFLYLKNGKEKSVVYKNMRIPLTESEWKVLVCLASSEGEAVSRESLRALFDTSDGNISDVYICHLRRKLEDPFGEKMIRTVRGKGYMLSVETKWE